MLNAHCVLTASMEPPAREQSNGNQTIEEGVDTWNENSPRIGSSSTPVSAQPKNKVNVKFESPRVPVIFVLGGPGSGKVTHCDNLMQEKEGIAHINMTDLLQQYAIGNDMQDFGQLSSKTVTEVLMLEMKMAPTAKTYLVSGFPRNMRDVVEYSEKIQMVNGVILIKWRQKVLERQIDYGAKLGQVVLSLARMELNNFYKNVMPVAEYFDQSHMLVSLNGERHPSEVYKEFKDSVIKILGMQDNPPVLGNGKAAPIPDEVSTELPTMQPVVSQNMPVPLKKQPSLQEAAERLEIEDRPKTQVISIPNNIENKVGTPVQGWPKVLLVIGGPGSNKAKLCALAGAEIGWRHVSLGKNLRTAAEPITQIRTKETNKIKDCISNGEMVPLDIVMKFVEESIKENSTSPGIILDGFPRDIEQIAEFEKRFKQKPAIILLDCSKLQLGRGRLDDTVTAFRRRLEIFRQASLPMLKAMDGIGRLTIVDGDTDTPAVQEDFLNVIKEQVEYLNSKPLNEQHAYTNGHLPDHHTDTFIQDLETTEPIQTISQHVSNGFANGGANHMLNGYANKMATTNGHGPPKAAQNGHIGNGVAKKIGNGSQNVGHIEEHM